MRLHVGITQLAKHLGRIDGLHVGEFTDFEEVVPSKATLRRWREALPHKFRIVITAPKALTDPRWMPKKGVKWPTGAQGFAPGDAALEIWRTLDKAAGQLRAFTILFRTPAEFRPTMENMDRLRWFFGNIKRKQYRLVWEPSGLWEQSQVLALCDELGIYPAFDPFDPEFENFDSDFKYLRIKAVNRTHMMDDFGFASLMEAAYGSKRTFVVFATHSPGKHARQFLDFVYSDDDFDEDIGWDDEE